MQFKLEKINNYSNGKNKFPRKGDLFSDKIKRLINPGQSEVIQGIDFYEEINCYEILLIKTALEITGGHQKRAAALLKLKPTTLNMKMKILNIGRA